MDFPYADLPANPSEAFPLRKSLKRPTLKNKLEKNGRKIVVWALVDSGADCCIFPASMEKALAIDLPNQRSSPFSGTAAATQLAYFETVRATVWNGNAAEEPITFDLDAGFCDTLEHVGLGLLGQQGFFSRFQVTFNYQGGVVSLVR
jgi:hypothetical protein